MNIRDILEQLDMIDTGCPECGGPISMFSDLVEGKKDACYYKVKNRVKVWHRAWARKVAPRPRVASAGKIPMLTVQAKPSTSKPNSSNADR